MFRSEAGLNAGAAPVVSSFLVSGVVSVAIGAASPVDAGMMKRCLCARRPEKQRFTTRTRTPTNARADRAAHSTPNTT